MDIVKQIFKRKKEKEKEMSLTREQTTLIRGSVPLLRDGAARG